MLQWKFTKTDYETTYTAEYNWYHFKVYEDKDCEFSDSYNAEVDWEVLYTWALWECTAYCYWFAEGLFILKKRM